ncbi:arsenate reductase ArsC [Caulobacter sp. FWC2]|uniref:arsenate reductase ArsC n=1 Tax=Caulobacter sp. FWC2 TaxID=69664 RepID=UPI000C14F9BC|nr:low molecular weight phosphatase family protein [Caulobacter sp. FWC2]PIB91325.1 low molecular weight phosphatase family protein [Caulobacter sp. FWC2]
MGGLPDAVLFTCNYNRVRSPMAEGLFKRFYGTRAFVDSCGLKPDPAGEGIDPFVVAVMDELGLDVSGHKPKTFAQLEDDSFDVVVSLTPEAQHRAVELSRDRAVEIEYWPTHDPTLSDGSREARLEAYRLVRDALAEQIKRRFGAPSTFGG